MTFQKKYSDLYKFVIWSKKKLLQYPRVTSLMRDQLCSNLIKRSHVSGTDQKNIEFISMKSFVDVPQTFSFRNWTCVIEYNGHKLMSFSYVTSNVMKRRESNLWSLQTQGRRTGRSKGSRRKCFFFSFWFEISVFLFLNSREKKGVE